MKMKKYKNYQLNTKRISSSFFFCETSFFFLFQIRHSSHGKYFVIMMMYGIIATNVCDVTVYVISNVSK